MGCKVSESENVEQSYKWKLECLATRMLDMPKRDRSVFLQQYCKRRMPGRFAVDYEITFLILKGIPKEHRLSFIQWFTKRSSEAMGVELKESLIALDKEMRLNAESARDHALASMRAQLA